MLYFPLFPSILFQGRKLFLTSTFAHPKPLNPLAVKSLVLFVGSVSSFGIDREPTPANLALMSIAVEKEATHIATTPSRLCQSQGEDDAESHRLGAADPWLNRP